MYIYFLVLGTSIVSSMFYAQYERKKLNKKYYSLLKKYEKNCKDEKELNIILDLIDEYEEYFAEFD